MGHPPYGKSREQEQQPLRRRGPCPTSTVQKMRGEGWGTRVLSSVYAPEVLLSSVYAVKCRRQARPLLAREVSS